MHGCGEVFALTSRRNDGHAFEGNQLLRHHLHSRLHYEAKIKSGNRNDCVKTKQTAPCLWNYYVEEYHMPNHHEITLQ
jgi:hypothetical protein